MRPFRALLAAAALVVAGVAVHSPAIAAPEGPGVLGVESGHQMSPEAPEGPGPVGVVDVDPVESLPLAATSVIAGVVEMIYVAAGSGGCWAYIPWWSLSAAESKCKPGTGWWVRHSIAAYCVKGYYATYRYGPWRYFMEISTAYCPPGYQVGWAFVRQNG